MSTCKFFAHGRCHLGEMCRFRHDIPISEAKGGRPTGADWVGIKHSHKNYKSAWIVIGFGKKKGLTNRFLAVPCKNFPHGLCSYGDSCSFIHAQPSFLAQPSLSPISDISPFPVTFPSSRPRTPSPSSNTHASTPRPLPPPSSDPSHTGPDWRVDLSRSHTPSHTTPLQPNAPIDWTHTPTLASTPATRSPIPATLKFPSLSPLPGVISFPSLSSISSEQHPEGEELESSSESYPTFNYQEMGALRFVLGNEESEAESVTNGSAGFEAGVATTYTNEEPLPDSNSVDERTESRRSDLAMQSPLLQAQLRLLSYRSRSSFYADFSCSTHYPHCFTSKTMQILWKPWILSQRRGMHVVCPPLNSIGPFINDR